MWFQLLGDCSYDTPVDKTQEQNKTKWRMHIVLYVFLDYWESTVTADASQATQRDLAILEGSLFRVTVLYSTVFRCNHCVFCASRDA